MRNLIFTLILMSVVSLLSACSSNWLDIKPDKSLTVPSTLRDLELLMEDYQSYTSGLAIGDLSSDLHYVTEAVWSGTSSDVQINAFTWTNQRPYLDVTDWKACYIAILNFNIVLEKLGDIVPQNEQEIKRWNEVRGSALFQRARFFFELAQIFAPPYKPESADKDLGVPLRTTSDINVKVNRGTLKETYNRILEDLLAAKSLLPDVPAYRTRASRPAAFAELSRVYMSMRNYEPALLYADSALKVINVLQDFNKLSPSAPNMGLFNVEVILHTIGVDYSLLRANYKVDNQLYASYDSNDLRKVIYFEKVADGTIGFKGNFNNSTAPFLGLTVSEQYLNRAECLARGGRFNEAISDLNTLVKSRWKAGKFIPFNATTSEQALNIILEERKKELVRRGLRWMDLRRLNMEPGRTISVTRTIGGQTYVLEPNSYRYTFPIPDDVIELSGMKQNTGWER